MRPTRAYLVLTLERTGSSMLCDALERTGALGTPYELFGGPIHRHASEAGVAAPGSTPEAPRLTSFPAYVDAVAERTASGGAFGSKVHRYQYLNLEQAGLVRSPLDMVPDDCRSTARLVLLTRADRKRQAISILRARATGIYGLVGRDRASTMKLPADPYWAERLKGSPGALRTTLDDILDTIVEHEQGWLRWLEIIEANALAVTYESLCDDYTGTVAKVARHVAGLDLRPGSIPAIRFQPQRDEMTELMLSIWR